MWLNAFLVFSNENFVSPFASWVWYGGTSKAPSCTVCHSQFYKGPWFRDQWIEYNGPNIDYEIYHQGGGGHLEAEGLGGDDPEGAAKRNIIAEHMWRDYQEYIAGREEDEETDISEEE